MGYELYASMGTGDFYQEHGVQVIKTLLLVFSFCVKLVNVGIPSYLTDIFCNNC